MPLQTPEISKRKLAEFCDIFCEEGYFNHEQTKKICNTARINNLGIKLHVDEFKDSNGAYLAGELNAISADHQMKSNAKLINVARGCIINEEDLSEALNNNVISGAAIAFAALLLIIPGFITDIFGFLLIIPITRKFFINKISARFKKKETNNDFIEGEITEEKKYKENGKDS